MQIKALAEHGVKLKKVFSVRHAPFRYNPADREPGVAPCRTSQRWTPVAFSDVEVFLCGG